MKKIIRYIKDLYAAKSYESYKNKILKQLKQPILEKRQEIVKRKTGALDSKNKEFTYPFGYDSFTDFVKSVHQEAVGFVIYNFIVNNDVDERFITEHAAFVDWTKLSKDKKMSEELIENFSELVYWDLIFIYQNLSVDFMEKHEHRLNINQKDEEWILQIDEPGHEIPPPMFVPFDPNDTNENHWFHFTDIPGNEHIFGCDPALEGEDNTIVYAKIPEVKEPEVHTTGYLRVADGQNLIVTDTTANVGLNYIDSSVGGSDNVPGKEVVQKLEEISDKVDSLLEKEED